MSDTRILAAVLLLGVVMPWVPTMQKPGETVGMYADPRHVLFAEDSDVYDGIWHFSWISGSVEAGRDPRVYGDMSLAWHNMGWPSLFLSIPLGYGYQTSLFVSSIFVALAGYFLARAWGLGRNGALLAAFIMVWMPVRATRMHQHYSLASIGYTMMTLAMVRLWLVRGRRFAWGAFIFSALAVMESLQHGFTIAAGWAVSLLLSPWPGKRRAALSAVIPAAGCIAGALWLLTSPGLTGNDPGKDWREAVYWGAEVQSYFLPALLGDPLLTGYMPNPWEGVVTPGFSVMLFAALYCAHRKNRKAAAAALAVMIMSIGPLFKFNGIPTPIPLPYMAIARTPWLSAARAPARLGMIVGLMAALGAGAFIEKRRRSAFWILTGAVLLELTPLSLNTISTAVPSWYLDSPPSSLRLEIPASSAIRRYSLFEAADGVPRRVKFFARGGEEMEEGIPPGLLWDPSETPVRGDLEATGAGSVVYNRWLFSPEERSFYDSLYARIFLPLEKADSIWVWVSP